MNRLSAALASVLFASAAFADIAPDPLGSGMTPRPRDREVTVAMASEVVDLELSKDRLGVKATFQMENQGAETAFEVGFPTSYDDDLKDFAVEAGGKKLQASLAEKQIEGPFKSVTEYWLVWPMKFAAGEKMTVVVTYWVKPNDRGLWIRDESSSTWDDRFGEEGIALMNRRTTGYILKTGAPWKGPIGSAVVNLALADGLTSAHLRAMSPPPVSIEAARVVWKFESFEPTKDIEVTFNPNLTIDEEIKAVHAAIANPEEGYPPLGDDMLFLLLLADLHGLKGDVRGRLATYEKLADLAMSQHAEEMTVDPNTADILLECVDQLLDGYASLKEPANGLRSIRKTDEFLEKWLLFTRGESDWAVEYTLPTVRLALARCRAAAGRDAGPLLRELARTWAWGGTLDLAPECEGAAALEEERATIAVGEVGVEFVSTFRIAGKRDGEITLLYDDLNPVETRLVALSDGFFDALDLTVDGAPLPACCIERTVRREYDEEDRTEWHLGWRIPLKAGASVDVRLRSAFPDRRTEPDWLWNPDRVLPTDEPGMERVNAAYSVRGGSWKGARKVSVVARFPKDFPVAHLRDSVPAGARVSEGEVRWEYDAWDPTAGDIHPRATVRRFSLAHEIEYIEKVLKSKPKCAEIAQLQLALACGAAGRKDDEIRLLRALVDAGAKPLQIEGGGSYGLSSGMYERRPVEFFLLDALLRAGKEEDARSLAPRALAALREDMEHHTPTAEDMFLEWEDLLVCFRLLGDEAGMKEAREQLEKLRRYR